MIKAENSAVHLFISADIANDAWIETITDISGRILAKLKK